ncbi:hypothetical protein ACUTAF_07975 [Pseudomonas sp. SP16.1]|uniref:hypothetical protein n=1 Tax=Pseudomonas sp. SP16.1 TaxID=3458854 RepID=UPI0040460BC6
MAWPKYAASYEDKKHLLVQYLCKRKCNAQRYGLVSKQPWVPAGADEDRSLFVTCLKCGGQQFDSYNWVRL